VLALALLPPGTEPAAAGSGRTDVAAPEGRDIPVQPPEPRPRRAPVRAGSRKPVAGSG